MSDGKSGPTSSGGDGGDRYITRKETDREGERKREG